MPKIRKNVRQMRTMLPMGLNDDSSVSTTSFKPGALLITLQGEIPECYRTPLSGAVKIVQYNKNVNCTSAVLMLVIA